jgi:hypothetical protein
VWRESEPLENGAPEHYTTYVYCFL